MPVKSLAPQVQEQWKKMGADYDKVQERLQNAMSLMQPIAEAEKALEHYTPTAGGEVRLMAAKVASGLGAPEALVRQIANGELASAQVFQSTMLDLATSRMRAALQGGGRFTNIEFQAFRDAKPNPNMTKEAVQELFAHYKRGIMLDQAYVEGYNHFADKGTSPTEFNNWLINLQNSYQKKMKENLK
jgi:hypothetical protein